MTSQKVIIRKVENWVQLRFRIPKILPPIRSLLPRLSPARCRTKYHHALFIEPHVLLSGYGQTDLDALAGGQLGCEFLGPLSAFYIIGQGPRYPVGGKSPYRHMHGKRIIRHWLLPFPEGVCGRTSHHQVLVHPGNEYLDEDHTLPFVIANRIPPSVITPVPPSCPS